MKPADLIGYCGVYCETCARWCENPALRQLATALAELVDAHGFHYWMPEVVKEFDYAEFRKALDFFSQENTWLVCQKGCKGGDGRPDCEIRDCCKSRGLDLCFDCEEFPCDKVKGDTKMIKRAEEYKKLGKDDWLRQQIEKARQGFELHTEKYYQIWAREYPSSQSPNKNER